jgi:hypothetical protein
MKNLLVTITLLCISIFSFGQDKIVKRDFKEILCKVSEIGTTEIKYKKAGNLDGPVYSVKKSEVLKIVFENGSEEKFETNLMSVVPSGNRHYKRAITTRPFSLISGHLSIGYQQALHPSRALIAEFGFIGPKLGEGEDATGAYGRIGFRLKRTPEVVMEGMEWGYNLSGMYVQPELTYSNFSSDGGGFSLPGRFSSSAFLLTLGKQMVVGDIVTFDLSGSLGYQMFNDSSPSSNTGLNEYFGRSRYYSHTTFGEESVIAWKLSLTMGILLK